MAGSRCGWMLVRREQRGEKERRKGRRESEEQRGGRLTRSLRCSCYCFVCCNSLSRQRCCGLCMSAIGRHPDDLFERVMLVAQCSLLYTGVLHYCPVEDETKYTRHRHCTKNGEMCVCVAAVWLHNDLSSTHCERERSGERSRISEREREREREKNERLQNLKEKERKSCCCRQASSIKHQASSIKHQA